MPMSFVCGKIVKQTTVITAHVLNYADIIAYVTLVCISKYFIKVMSILCLAGTFVFPY